MSERVLWLVRDAHRASKQGAAALSLRQRARLAALVAYTRAHSPSYRDLYAGLPDMNCRTLTPKARKIRPGTRVISQPARCR